MSLIGQGGGFFGSGASSSSAETRTSSNETGQQAGGSALNLNLGNTSVGKKGRLDQEFNLTTISTDHGAVSGALDFASGAVGSVANVATDLVDASLSTGRSFFDGAIALVSDVVGTSVSAVTRANDNAVALISDANYLAAEQNLAVLGVGERLANSTTNAALMIAEQAERQASEGLAFAARESDANRVLMSDSLWTVNNAYSSANQGLLALSDVALDNYAALQSKSITAINENAQAAQTSSLKALDYVFESTKTEGERVTDTAIKWVIGAAVAMVAVPLAMRAFAK